MKSCALVLILAGPSFVLSTIAPAAEMTMSRLYEVTTEIGMPHLEENLRYATRVERSCMNPRQLTKAFPMLGDVSLQDCELVETEEEARDTLLYRLQCSGGHGTMGSALGFRLEHDHRHPQRPARWQEHDLLPANYRKATW